ncbi:hypothetical protein [Spiroplasma poulsonii]|nr:hypothetical protein [Spiroplasma poulsonii]UNF61273.1 hypothetical protein MNU24_04985 [Spiroplasma poulsonii]
MRIYQDYVSDKMIWDNDVNYSSIAGSYIFYIASFLIGFLLLLNLVAS